MIIGSATLELSQEVLVLAVQEYLDKRVSEGFRPKVISVTSLTKNGYGQKESFKVDLSEAKPVTG